MGRVGLLGIWLVCALCAVLAVPWMLVSILFGSPRTWTLAKGFDRVGNVMTGVDDEYLSAKARRTQGGVAVGIERPRQRGIAREVLYQEQITEEFAGVGGHVGQPLQQREEQDNGHRQRIDAKDPAHIKGNGGRAVACERGHEDQGGVHKEDRHTDTPHGAKTVEGGLAAIRQLQQQVTDDDQENRNRSDAVEVGQVCDRHRRDG